MSKHPSNKLDHCKSFRDELIPYVNSKVFPAFDQQVDYPALIEMYKSGRTGFGDFLATDIGKFIYSGQIFGYAPIANELYSVSVWDGCGRVVLRPSEGLIRLLMETEASVPISEVHPPFPSVFIEIPRGLLSIPDATTGRMVDATGMYVAWGDLGDTGDHSKHIELTGGTSFNDCNRQARLLAIGRGDPTEDHRIHNWALRYQSMCWTDPCEHSVDYLTNLHIKKLADEVLKDDPVRTFMASATVWRDVPDDEFMLRIASNLFLYMSCPDADVLKNPSELHDRLADFKKRKVSSKRRKSVKRQIEEGMVPSVTMDIGTSIVIQPDTSYSDTDAPSEGGRKSPRPHWRRGHFRNVRFGEGRKKKKLKWIMPVLVRKGDAGETEVKAYEVRQ